MTFEVGDSEFQAVARPDRGLPEAVNRACFYHHPVLHKNKSKEAGREIYEDKVYILILCPGQSKQETRRPASDQDRMNYPTAWRAFCEGRAEPLVGTPIEHLPGLTPARCKELHAVHVRTVEQLANVPDQNLPALGMGGTVLKQQAQAFIQKNSSEVAALKHELTEARRMVDELKQMIAKQGSDLPKPRGRPRKEATNVPANSVHSDSAAP